MFVLIWQDKHWESQSTHWEPRERVNTLQKASPTKKPAGQVRLSTGAILTTFQGDASCPSRSISAAHTGKPLKRLHIFLDMTVYDRIMISQGSTTENGTSFCYSYLIPLKAEGCWRQKLTTAVYVCRCVQLWTGTHSSWQCQKEVG